MRKLALILVILGLTLPCRATVLRQGTTVTVTLKPIIVFATGARKTSGVTLHAAHILLSKNGGAFAAKNSSTAPTVDATTGCRQVTLDATDTGTVGRLIVDWPDDVNGVTAPEPFDVAASVPVAAIPVEIREQGSTSQSLDFVLYNSAGEPNTGTITIANLDLYVGLAGHANAAKADLAALANDHTAWTSGRAFAMGGGRLRVDIPDANLSDPIGSSLLYWVADPVSHNQTAWKIVLLNPAVDANSAGKGLLPTQADVQAAIADVLKTDYRTGAAPGSLIAEMALVRAAPSTEPNLAPVNARLDDTTEGLRAIKDLCDAIQTYVAKRGRTR
jgi:hypothetical protein